MTLIEGNFVEVCVILKKAVLSLKLVYNSYLS